MKDTRLINHLADILIDIGKADDNLEGIQQELRSVLAVMKDKMVKKALSHTMFSVEEKKRILEGIISSLRISEGVASFLTILLEDERLPYLREISQRYEELSDKILHQKKVVVTTAIPLKERERENLARSFERITGSKVKIEERIDRQILGGVVARIGDRLIDGSIRSSLDRLRQELAK